MIAVLVALAGCSALPGSGGDSSSGVESVSYPDGASQDGIDDPQQIIKNHQQSLTGEDYTVTQVQNQKVGDRERHVQVTVQVDSTDQRFIAAIERGNATATSFFDNGTIYTKESVNDTTQYSSNESRQSFSQYQTQFTGAQIVGQIVSSVDLEATEVRDEGDSTLIVYNVTGLSDQPPQQSGNIEVSGQLVIDTDGQIHAFQFKQEGKMQSSTINISVSDIGETDVKRPDWAVSEEENTTTEDTTDESTQNESES